MIHPSTREEARKQKSELYFTGKLCPQLHRYFRYTSNGACQACVSPAHHRKCQPIEDDPQPVIRNAPAGPRPCKRGHVFEGRTCGVCQKRTNQRWRTAHRADEAARQRTRIAAVRVYVRRLKSTAPCRDCERKYPWFVTEFDHKDGRGHSDATVSSLIGRGNLSRVKEEIAKCDLVCANCHKVRTHERAVRKGERRE